MKLLSLDQPMAAGAVLGARAVLNLPRSTRQRGPILIHARTAGGGRLSDDADPRSATAAVLGLVRLDDVAPPDLCQLPGAHGPWCWVITHPLIFPVPVPLRIWTRPGDLVETPDAVLADVTEAIGTAVPPERWERPALDLDPDAVNPFRADGRTGD